MSFSQVHKLIIVKVGKTMIKAALGTHTEAENHHSIPDIVENGDQPL